MNLNKKFKRNKGITLIALVVTIIVLLILAGISISMLTGQNGILNRASEAKKLNGIAQNEELVKLSAMDALSQGLGTITDANLKTALNSNIGEGKYEITGDATNGWTVTVDGQDYRVEATGGSVNWNKILEDANKNPESMKHKEQVKSSFIGIGTDGKPVNMDLWRTSKKGDGTWGIFSCESAYAMDYAYDGGIDDDGKIVGKIPQYIYSKEEERFVEVTDLSRAFYRCTGLTTAPEIPSSVIYMSETFTDCKRLTTAPEIPNSVKDMDYTFQWCTGLTTAPEIPNSVTSIDYTFDGCTGLTTAPEIPNSVTSMSSTFSGCTGLTTAPEIPNSVTSMSSTFSGCTGLTTAPEIPNSVTRMTRTFSGCTNLTGEITINANLDGSSKWVYGSCFDGTTKPIQLTGTCPILSELAKTSENGNVTVK